MSFKKAKLVVLISGRGSNLCAIDDAIQNKKLNADLVAVISNRSDAQGLKEAQQRSHRVLCIDEHAYASHALFEDALLEQLQALAPDIIALAGFMSILSSTIVEPFRGKIVNIHPSLLPKHKGLNTHRRALEENDSEHGCTTHFVSETVDAGATIKQATILVESNTTESQLAKHVLEQEHLIYPETLELMCREQISYRQNTCYFNGKPLHKPLPPGTLQSDPTT